MLLFLLFCLPLLTFTRNQIQQKVLAYAIAPPILQTHVIDNWWGVLYPPPALSGGVMPYAAYAGFCPICPGATM